MASHRKLLVIGEDSDTANAIAAALGRRGWRVELAATKQDGFERAIALQPDAVVTELDAHHAQPLAIARSIRTCVEHDVVVVGVAAGALGIAEEARAAGFDAVFEPPLDLDALAHQLDAACRMVRP